MPSLLPKGSQKFLLCLCQNLQGLGQDATAAYRGDAFISVKTFFTKVLLLLRLLLPPHFNGSDWNFRLGIYSITTDLWKRKTTAVCISRKITVFTGTISLTQNRQSENCWPPRGEICVLWLWPDRHFLYRFREPLAMYPSGESAPVGSSFVSEQQKHGGRAGVNSHRLSAAKGETGGVRDWLKSPAILSVQIQCHLKWQKNYALLLHDCDTNLT